jgi:hypothetical protein
MRRLPGAYLNLPTEPAALDFFADGLLQFSIVALTSRVSGAPRQRYNLRNALMFLRLLDQCPFLGLRLPLIRSSIRAFWHDDAEAWGNH